MDINKIAENEEHNDGKTIFLYYNNEVGFYTAYGTSAFLVSHVVDPISSFSKDLQLPVVLINPEQILELRHSLNKLQHTEKTFYEFTLKRPFGTQGYARWANSLKQ
jgi:hypothetical protein